jgi:hypothetical protein
MNMVWIESLVLPKIAALKHAPQHPIWQITRKGPHASPRHKPAMTQIFGPVGRIWHNAIIVVNSVETERLDLVARRFTEA